MGYGEAKIALLNKINEYFAPARAKRKSLSSDPAYVESVLQEGARRARQEADKTMALVRTAVGFAERPSP
jgi:tryptophanyl-tRNA synthetase